MKLSFSILLSITALLCSTTNATLTDSEKSALLSRHKSTRNSVGANNMASISWDNGLAASAEAYAKKCPGTTHDRKQQNLAKGSSGPTSLYDLWANEKSDFLKSGQVDFFTGDDYNGKHVGHYSQIVWAKNTKVGCGFHKCSGFNQLVCHYGTGNYERQKVYEGGQRGKKEEKKTTVKKTTVQKTTTVKKTTTVAKPPPAPTPSPASSVKVNFAPPNQNAAKSIKASATTINKGIPVVGSAATTTKVPAGTTINKLATQTAGLNTKNLPGANNVTGAAGANNVKDKGAKGSSKVINIEEDNKGGNTGTVVTGIAITGSVVGAAAAFVFLKKNPKQYEKLTRSLSSVKRGATVVTRKFTVKKTKTTPPSSSPSTIPEHNNEASDTNYRVDFAENMQTQV